MDKQANKPKKTKSKQALYYCRDWSTKVLCLFLFHPLRKHYLSDLVDGVVSGEEGAADVHLDQDAREAPHVDRHRVRAPEQHLGAAVVPS